MILNSTLQEMNNKELTVQIIQIQNDIKEMNKYIIEIKQEIAPTNKIESKWYQNRDLQEALIFIVFIFYTTFVSPRIFRYPKTYEAFKNQSSYVQLVANNQIFMLIFIKRIFDYFLNS